MYKTKLTEQLALLEKWQSQCAAGEIPELLTLSKSILAIAKKIDELEQRAQTNSR